jgi:hypothetical protein
LPAAVAGALALPLACSDLRHCAAGSWLQGTSHCRLLGKPACGLLLSQLAAPSDPLPALPTPLPRPALSQCLLELGGYTYLDVRPALEVEETGSVQGCVHVPLVIATPVFDESGRREVETSPNAGFLQQASQPSGHCGAACMLVCMVKSRVATAGRQQSLLVAEPICLPALPCCSALPPRLPCCRCCSGSPTSTPRCWWPTLTVPATLWTLWRNCSRLVTPPLWACRGEAGRQAIWTCGPAFLTLRGAFTDAGRRPGQQRQGGNNPTRMLTVIFVMPPPALPAPAGALLPGGAYLTTRAADGPLQPQPPQQQHGYKLDSWRRMPLTRPLSGPPLTLLTPTHTDFTLLQGQFVQSLRLFACNVHIWFSAHPPDQLVSLSFFRACGRSA